MNYMNHVNNANETEIIVFENDRIYVYSDTDSDYDDDYEPDILENLLPPEVDIYSPTKWDEIAVKRYRNHPEFWNWLDWELEIF